MFTSSLTLGVGMIGIGTILVFLGFKEKIINYLKNRKYRSGLFPDS